MDAFQDARLVLELGISAGRRRRLRHQKKHGQGTPASPCACAFGRGSDGNGGLRRRSLAVRPFYLNRERLARRRINTSKDLAEASRSDPRLPFIPAVCTRPMREEQSDSSPVAQHDGPHDRAQQIHGSHKSPDNGAQECVTSRVPRGTPATSRRLERINTRTNQFWDWGRSLGRCGRRVTFHRGPSKKDPGGDWAGRRRLRRRFRSSGPSNNQPVIIEPRSRCAPRLDSITARSQRSRD